MKIALTALLVLLTVSGCDFNKSVHKDLVSGLLTKGDGLTCDDVYLSVNDEKTNRNSFIYGEEFFMNFSDIKGFKEKNKIVFPGMLIYITSKGGDTVFQTNDLYSDYTDGLKLSPLLLSSNITVASPMKSMSEYTLFVKIWDKKDKGTFTAEMDFKIVPNEQIEIEANRVSYSEIYLFSQERNKVITDDKIKYDENTYVILEGLSGFREENGMVFPGLSLKATDADNKVILDYSDLFTEYNNNGIAVTGFNTRVSSHFKLTGSAVKNPLHCEVTIWDKKSDAGITVRADMILE